jgi:hypothetical protein
MGRRGEKRNDLGDLGKNVGKRPTETFQSRKKNDRTNERKEKKKCVGTTRREKRKKSQGRRRKEEKTF